MGDLPPDGLPRERLLRLGTAALADRELVALLLRSGTATVSALDLADRLVADFGSLGRLSEARPEELMATTGIGPSKATALVAAFALARRATGASQARVIRRPEDVVDAVRPLLTGLRRERVVVVVCDTAHRVRRVEIVSEGAADRSLFPVREILNVALRHDGRAFALAHNHPSGDPEPSEVDRGATEAVIAGARAVGLRFLGHVVVAHARMAEVNPGTR
jgi:DNA repair protein RadC